MRLLKFFGINFAVWLLPAVVVAGTDGSERSAEALVSTVVSWSLYAATMIGLSVYFRLGMGASDLLALAVPVIGWFWGWKPQWRLASLPDRYWDVAPRTFHPSGAQAPTPPSSWANSR